MATSRKSQTPVTPDGLTQEALDQAQADQDARAAEPNKAVVREAKEGIGGESFAYLDPANRAPAGGGTGVEG